MYNLTAQESFSAAEDGINTRHYVKGDKFKVADKEFYDLLVSKGHAKPTKEIETGKQTELETKVIEPKETKTSKSAKTETK